MKVRTSSRFKSVSEYFKSTVHLRLASSFSGESAKLIMGNKLKTFIFRRKLKKVLVYFFPFIKVTLFSTEEAEKNLFLS